MTINQSRRDIKCIRLQGDTQHIASYFALSLYLSNSLHIMSTCQDRLVNSEIIIKNTACCR